MLINLISLTQYATEVFFMFLNKLEPKLFGGNNVIKIFLVLEKLVWVFRQRTTNTDKDTNESTCSSFQNIHGHTFLINILCITYRFNCYFSP